MGDARVGVLGTAADALPTSSGRSAGDMFDGGDAPGRLGVHEPVPLDVPRVIAKVTKDWDPVPNPSGDLEIVARGSTLAQAAGDLDALESGQGSGSLFHRGGARGHHQ
jgi:hypothetical protein